MVSCSFGQGGLSEQTKIIIGVVAGIVSLILIAAVVFLLLRTKRRRGLATYNDSFMSKNATQSSGGSLDNHAMDAYPSQQSIAPLVHETHDHSKAPFHQATELQHRTDGAYDDANTSRPFGFPEQAHYT